MFKIEYKIINNEYDDLIGQNGFFQLVCNGYSYGKMYPEEIESVMNKVSIFDWFERLIRVTENLATKKYVALSDVESYNTWIEFKKEKDNIVISIIRANKGKGSKDIEYQLSDTEIGEWYNQIVHLNQFTEEVISKAKRYFEYIVSQNKEQDLFTGVINRIKNL